MIRRTYITGLGTVSAAGLGAEAFWASLKDGTCHLKPMSTMDGSGLGCTLAGEVPAYKIRDFVPKTYRKATKVMARDTEIAVIAADLAVRDAGLCTKGVDADAPPTHPHERSGCHIGAGLIAADLDELTGALIKSTDANGDFDIGRWGQEGMQGLTPLWLLKYLPNMLACHVTIIHDFRGPSNTITAEEASGGLSIGESLSVIQRGAADLCLSGGCETKLNPMALMRQRLTGRLHDAPDPAQPELAVRPMDTSCQGTVIGEGGALVVMQALDDDDLAARKQSASDAEVGRPYAEVIGYGAAQSVNRAQRNLRPDAEGRAVTSAVKRALQVAGCHADDVDLIVPAACGDLESDASEAAGLKTVFGERLSKIPMANPKPLIGLCCAGTASLDVAAACLCLHHQTVPRSSPRPEPIPGTAPGHAQATSAALKVALVIGVARSGQTTALLLRHVD